MLISVQISFSQENKKAEFYSKHNDNLYIGIDNIIEMKVEGISNKDIILTITSGVIKETDEGKIIVNVRNTGKSTLKAFYNNKLIGFKEFNCYGVPDPLPALMIDKKIYKYGEIPIEELLKAEKLFAYMGPNFESPFVVTKFMLSVNRDGFDASAISNTENFTEVQKELLLKIKKGSRIYFENVFCVGPDGSNRVLPNMILTVK